MNDKINFVGFVHQVCIKRQTQISVSLQRKDPKALKIHLTVKEVNWKYY